MAAPGEVMAGVGEDSSSSDDEQLRRCQEAVWDTPALKTNDSRNNEKPSKRLVVADHEHDGNELQVTQGFQTHVAKKLGLILEGLISEKQPSDLPCVDIEKQDNKEDEDEGFRLFSTSVPGQKTEEPPAPKRPLPSSNDSDSEMEMRLKEAAVSVKDLLSSALALATNSATETPSSEKKRKVKKKNRKLNQEEKEKMDLASNNDFQNNVNTEEEQTTVKWRKKKKKKKKKKAISGN